MHDYVNIVNITPICNPVASGVKQIVDGIIYTEKPIDMQLHEQCIHYYIFTLPIQGKCSI